MHMADVIYMKLNVLIFLYLQCARALGMCTFVAGDDWEVRFYFHELNLNNLVHKGRKIIVRLN